MSNSTTAESSPHVTTSTSDVAKSSSHNDRLVGLHEVEHLTSLRKSSLYMLMKRGEFPQGIPLTTRRRAWLERDVQDFIDKRIHARTISSTSNMEGMRLGR